MEKKSQSQRYIFWRYMLEIWICCMPLCQVRGHILVSCGMLLYLPCDASVSFPPTPIKEKYSKIQRNWRTIRHTDITIHNHHHLQSAIGGLRGIPIPTPSQYCCKPILQLGCYISPLPIQSSSNPNSTHYPSWLLSFSWLCKNGTNTIRWLTMNCIATHKPIHWFPK